jgi:hypothetical protein
MELLYFISGILTVGILYGVKLLRTVKSSHTDLLARYQSQSNISSIRYGDLNDDLKTVEELVMDISSKMEKDQYESVAGINKELELLKGQVYNIQERQDQGNQQKMKLISDNINEIQQLKQGIKNLSQNPNFTTNY